MPEIAPITMGAINKAGCDMKMKMKAEPALKKLKVTMTFLLPQASATYPPTSCISAVTAELTAKRRPMNTESAPKLKKYTDWYGLIITAPMFQTVALNASIHALPGR